MVSEAQRRAHQKHEGERQKRSPIWLEPALAKKVDRAVKKLGLPSRVAWVEHCLKSADAAKAIFPMENKMPTALALEAGQSDPSGTLNTCGLDYVPSYITTLPEADEAS